MLVHIIRMTAIITLIIACMLLPFLPGRYDGLAKTLSTMAQFFGVIGLLMVPIGALWLVQEVRKRGFAYYFAIASVVGLSIVAAAVSLAALGTLGISAGAIAIAIFVYGLFRYVKRLKLLKSQSPWTFNAVPLYLVVIPTAVAFAQFLLMPRAVEFSRDLAIRNSTELIDEIEQYHEVNGSYPESLLALHSDYDPSVVGIERYQYSANGKAYNLCFEQLSNRFGTQEIVVYNKLNEHVFPGHDSDILRWTPEQLMSRRGYYAVNDASSPHWKYFWFD